MFRIAPDQLPYFFGLSCDLVIAANLVSRPCNVKRWPSLAVYIAASFAIDGIRPHLSRVGQFYLYWGWFAAAAVLKIWVLCDAVECCPELEEHNAFIRSGAVLTAISAAIFSLAFSYLDPVPHIPPMLAFAAELSSAVSLGAVGAFAGFFAYARIRRAAWTRRGLLFSYGVILSSLGCAIGALLYEHAAYRKAATRILPISATINLAFWTLGVLLPDKLYTRDPLAMVPLHQLPAEQ